MNGKPHILWLMTDEQRTDSLGCYGSPWARTPNLDRLASRGVLFRHAVTPSPMCGPARVSLLTGRMPHETGVWNHHVPARSYDHWIGRFREAGYRTAAFGKLHHFSDRPVFETEREVVLTEHVHYFRYAERYREEAYGAIRFPGPSPWLLGGKFPADAGQTQEATMVREAIRWLEDRKEEDGPFFLKLSFNGPHTPVTPPAPYDAWIGEGSAAWPDAVMSPASGEPRWLQLLRDRYAGTAGRLAEDRLRAARRAYYGYVSFLDAQFGILLDWLEAKGLLDDTLIAFVSDHGTHIGDYGLVQKQTFYAPVAEVPFVVAGPAGRIAQGIRLETPVETRLLLPLLAELAGVSGERGRESAAVVGAAAEAAKELRNAVARGVEPAARPVFSELRLNPPEVGHDGRLVLVRDGRLKLSLCLDPKPHDVFMTDLSKDPYETVNVCGDPAYRAERDRLIDCVFNGLGV